MKRIVFMPILLSVSVFVLLIGCTAPPTNQLAVDTNKNTNNTDSAAVLTESAAIAQEKAIWDTIKNKNYDAFAAQLANDQIEVSPDGIFDRAGTIASIKDFEPSELTFSDWKFLPIDKDAIVLTYSVAVKGKYKGQELKPESVRASSAWVNRDGKWMAIYHQTTPVSTASPPPSPSPSAYGSPATSPSPASSPIPITTTDDVIANERSIWDALKTKNYDGFAAALANESIEVEPNGVWDKAGTMRLIRGFDFSRAELSDFKAVPFDRDAALVVYKVKLPGPEPGEYHSTIWANRDGKWMAVFHQGSPISAAAPASPATPATTPSSQ